MSIQIGNYHADGPFGNVESLLARSGVYVILGRTGGVAWQVVDVGESGNVHQRVSSHDRAPSWQRQGHDQLGVAAIYCDEPDRMLIERQLRALFNPACGSF